MNTNTFFVNSFECLFDKAILNQPLSLHYKNIQENILFEVHTIHNITEEDITSTVDLSFADLFEILGANGLWHDNFLTLTVKNFLESIDIEIINDAFADEVADMPLY